jgi:voltage-gated potassium channel
MLLFDSRLAAHTRLFQASLLLVLIFAGGTLGYRVIEGPSWWDAFYMTVITLTTVGYGEVFPLSRAGEAFTALLLLSGLGAFLLLATDLARTVIEGELRQYLGRVRRSRMIERMSGHEIVCGYGRMGRTVVDELRRARRPVVVVDRNPERLRVLEEAGLSHVAGDATLEGVLREANVVNARGLVSCLNDDAHNIYTVLTARALNPKLFIVARATEESAERRILQAGADRVVNPYHLGGSRLAHLLFKPAIISFFDASLDGTELQLDQTSLAEGSPIVKQTLAEADMRRRWGLGVVAVQRDRQVFPSPSPDLKLQAGDVLVVFGTRRQIEAFEAQCGAASGR